MYDFTERSCSEFVDVLGSSEPVPGGGGASALVGAIGVALGNMVASLTMGYQKYQDRKEEMENYKAKCKALQDKLLALVKQDATGFEPLSRAYRLPADTPNRDKIMEEATLEACKAPMGIMETICEAMDLIQILADRGARLAVSDAGCAAACCRGALYAASLNIFINTKSLKNREIAEGMNKKTNDMLAHYGELGDKIFETVKANFF